MKFKQINIGACFRYRDVVYTKTGPFQAVAEGGSKPQMIIQAALVTLLDDKGGASESADAAKSNVVLRKAVDEYHQSCLELLQQVAPEQIDLQEKLEQQRQKILRVLVG